MPKITFAPYTPLPDDTYLCRISGCQEMENQQTHEFFYSWTFEVSDENSEFNGQQFRVASPLRFGPGAVAYKMFVAAGMPEQDLLTEFDTDDFIGAELYVKLKITKDSKGREINKPESFISIAEMEALVARHAKPIVKSQAIKPTHTATNPPASQQVASATQKSPISGRSTRTTVIQGRGQGQPAPQRPQPVSSTAPAESDVEVEPESEEFPD